MYVQRHILEGAHALVLGPDDVQLATRPRIALAVDPIGSRKLLYTLRFRVAAGAPPYGLELSIVVAILLCTAVRRCAPS